MTTYSIVRMFQNDHNDEIIKEGLTLEEAKTYCRDPQSSSKSCTTKEGMALTESMGPWFCGFQEE